MCGFLGCYTGNSLVLGHRRLCRGLLGARTSPVTPRTPRCSDIASDVGDSSLLGARSSPATSGTPRCLDIASYAGDSSVLRSCYVSSVCYQAAPCCSDQGADLGQHVWGLDMHIDKLLDLFSLTLLQDLFLHLLASSRTKWLHFT